MGSTNTEHCRALFGAGHPRLVTLSGLGAVLAVALAFVPQMAPDRLSAAFGGLALVAAVTAVLLALPGYREWLQHQRAKPEMRIRLEVGRAESNKIEAVDGETTVDGLGFDVRVNIANRGNAPLRWAVLSTYVLEPCKIVVLDPPAKRHYRSPWSAWNREISGSEEPRVNFTAAERDFPPGHHFLYHARVKTPRPGRWPVAALLEGDPPLRIGFALWLVASAGCPRGSDPMPCRGALQSPRPIS